jgi:glycine/D-amino acid oxidase-like deaminating enzyme
MPNPDSNPKQPEQAASPQAGWLTRAQVAAELGYRSIFPIRKMEGQALHPVRTARGWLFEPEEVAALKLKRPIGNTTAPLSEGRLAARVFHLFDTGRELREIVEELEVAPAIVRDLWHEWLVDLEEGEQNRRKTAQEERRRHAEETQLRELERRNEQEQKNFETIMAAMNATTGQSDKR